VHLHEIFGRIAARGHEVHLLCKRVRWRAVRGRRDGIRVHRVSGRYGFALAGRARSAPLAGRLGPDVVRRGRQQGPPLPAARVVRPSSSSCRTSSGRPPSARSRPVARRRLGLRAADARVYGRAAVEAISHSTADDLAARGSAGTRSPSSTRGGHPSVCSRRPGSNRLSEPTFFVRGRLKRYKEVETRDRRLALVRASGQAARLLSPVRRPPSRPGACRRRAGVTEAVEFLGS